LAVGGGVFRFANSLAESTSENFSVVQGATSDIFSVVHEEPGRSCFLSGSTVGTHPPADTNEPELDFFASLVVVCSCFESIVPAKESILACFDDCFPTTIELREDPDDDDADDDDGCLRFLSDCSTGRDATSVGSETVFCSILALFDDFFFPTTLELLEDPDDADADDDDGCLRFLRDCSMGREATTSVGSGTVFCFSTIRFGCMYLEILGRSSVESGVVWLDVVGRIGVFISL
jgi:hypothetical protein